MEMGRKNTGCLLYTSTAGAISFFQRQHGLEQDGVCGPQTLAVIYTDEAKPYTLLEGTSGDDVDLLQERLQELGYLGKATGYYGTETVDAVKRFQEPVSYTHLYTCMRGCGMRFVELRRDCRGAGA